MKNKDIQKIVFSKYEKGEGRTVHASEWDKVTSKTLVEELKKAVKRIRTEVVFESCSSWTSRLYRLSKNDGCYLR